MDSVETEILNNQKQKLDKNTLIKEAILDAEETEVFTSVFSSKIIFFGKSLNQWEDHLRIYIPPAKELDRIRMKEIYAEIANNVQIASHYYSLCAFSSTLLKNSVSFKKQDLLNEFVQEYTTRNLRPPSQAQLEKIINLITQRLSNFTAVASLLKHYWREKLEMYDRIEKAINSIAIGQAVELKHLES